MARQANLLSVEEARERILAHFEPLDTETVALEHALNRTVSATVRAGMDVPPFANSSMDGFALRSDQTNGADREAPSVFRITAQIAAGSVPSTAVQAGQCARIMTGAPLPVGADAVIPFEEVEERDGRIRVFGPVKPGSSVRPAGNDITNGRELVRPGATVTSRVIGLLASVGQAEVPVRRRPVVAILSTGDELVAPGHLLGPGQIFNSNSPMLDAAVREAGGDPRLIRAVGDDPGAIAEAVRAAEDADLLITSGGASVGDFDYVKDVIGQGGTLDFWRVRIRPGKPLLFGAFGSMPVIGLPGNPTSALVTFEQFVRPAIMTMLGAPTRRPEIDAVVDERIDNRGGRRTYFRVRLRYAGGFHASLAGPQDSAMLLPLADADGLLVVDEDRVELLPGDGATVQVWRLPPPA